jgi:hypothetical protein
MPTARVKHLVVTSQVEQKKDAWGKMVFETPFD